MLHSGAVRVLLIDDDVELCVLLRKFLKQKGFNLDCEHDGTRGMERALSEEPDLVVLDVMLPGMDGFEILRRMRQESRVPILMLTARGEDVDRIVGLELGADDYLPKPFNPHELAARIRAVMRRLETQVDAAPRRLEVNGVTLDYAARQVRVDHRQVELTTLEFDILEMLMRAAGRILSRDAIIENLYDRKATAFDRSINVHISHLRKKLEADRTLIKTIRGVGYQFCLTGEGEPAA